MAQAVFRIQKLKTRGNVSAALAHNLRQRPTPNADPRRENVVLKSGGLDELDQTLGDQKIRSNAVLAVECVISASPEYFRPDDPSRAGEWDEERLQAWRDAMEPWIRENFPNAISVVLHLDEATPHYQVVDVPLDENGKLNCRGRYGGRETLSQWQTRVAEPVERLGIKRGNEKSAARHVEIASYYGHVNRKTPGIPEITTPKPRPLPERRTVESVPFTESKRKRDAREQQHKEQTAEWRKQAGARNRARLQAFEQVEAKAADRDLADKQRREAKVTAQRASDERARLERERDKIREELKQQADRLRELDIDDVLARMYGAQLDKGSKPNHRSRKYKLGDGREIAVSEGTKGQIWVEQGAQKGARGAINLVMRLEGVEFKDAVARLASVYDHGAVAGDLTAMYERRAQRQVQQLAEAPVRAPEPVPGKWAQVRDWLTKVRGLPSKLIDDAHQQGKVYADRFANAVFPRRDGGAFLRGTGPQRWMRTIGGKSAGPYIAGQSGDVWIVESPLDALAVKAAHPDATAIACGGNLLSPAELRAHVPEGRRIHLAFDRDAQGQRLFEQAREIWPDARDGRAEQPAKDWAEAVQKLPYLVHDQFKPGRRQAPQIDQAPARPTQAPRRRPGPSLGG